MSALKRTPRAGAVLPLRGGAAHHGAVLPHGQRGTGGAGRSPGRIRDRLENRVEAVISGCNQLFQGRQGCAFVKIFRDTGGAGRGCGRGLRRRRVRFFSEPNGLGLGTTTVFSRLVSCRTKPAGRKWLGRFRRSMSQLRPPVKASDGLVVTRFEPCHYRWVMSPAFELTAS